MKRKCTQLLVGLSLAAALGSVIAEEKEKEKEKEEVAIDPLSGLKMAPGWEVVRASCITCHSAKQFLQQRGTRQTWDHVIDWMQERGGLLPLDKETRNTILDYLEVNHGPGESFRRPPIPASLMPENPYVSEIRKQLEAEAKKKSQ
jgi:hypothetical protein